MATRPAVSNEISNTFFMDPPNERTEDFPPSFLWVGRPKKKQARMLPRSDQRLFAAMELIGRIISTYVREDVKYQSWAVLGRPPGPKPRRLHWLPGEYPQSSSVVVRKRARFQRQNIRKSFGRANLRFTAPCSQQPKSGFLGLAARVKLSGLGGAGTSGRPGRPRRELPG